LQADSSGFWGPAQGTPDIYAGWNDVMVYLKTGAAGSTTEIKPINLEANVVVPKEKFQIPAGCTLQ
jgi:hypothetical protein